MAEYLVLQKYQGYQGTQMLFFRPGDILDDRFVDINALREGGASIIALDPAWLPYISNFKSALNQGNDWEVITAYFLSYGLIGGGGGAGTRHYKQGLSPTGNPRIFTTAVKFVHTATESEKLYYNGQLQEHGATEDYTASESGGAGTGYDTITFVRFTPRPTANIRIDYTPL